MESTVPVNLCQWRWAETYVRLSHIRSSLLHLLYNLQFLLCGCFFTAVVRLHASSILQRPSTLLISHYIYGMRKVLVTSEEPEFKSLASLINQYYSNNSFVSLDSFVPLHIVQASGHDLLLCCENKMW
ncbi:hypothetical protein CFP56_007823 [Quercus suber]|uniref:Uncharacterized protein n=1 Tax=Quercus suber TaxID=58331 RepID=A0AAW0M721_QUESU